MERLLPGLRHADASVVCGVALPAGATAWWDARAVVREALAAGHDGVPVRGVLCFTAGDLPCFKTLELGEYLVVDRRRLGKQLDADGPLAAAIEAIERALAVALPPR